MGFIDKLKKKVANMPETNGQRPDLAFCEPSTVTGDAPWHIRILGDEGRKLTGGARGETLCGRVLPWGSWDLERPVNELEVRAAKPREGDGKRWVCPRCVAALVAPPEAP